MNLVWLRNDLRLTDNPALYHALDKQQTTAALFILTPKQHQIHGEAPQKLEFIKAHVKNLCQRLKKLNVETIIRTVPTFNEIPSVFQRLLDELPIDSVSFNHNYWLNEQKRDEAVIKLLKDNSIKVQQYHSHYLLPPGSVRKANGEMYHVFTPFKNKFIEALKQQYQAPLSVPKPCAENTTFTIQNDELDVDFDSSQWPIGELKVTERLKSFLQTNDYQDQRDYPAINGTSSLSPYLAIGAITAKQCLAHALKQHGEQAFNSTWVSELIWRDFYNDLMFEYPKLAKHKAFKSDAKDEWLHQPDLFEKWQQGHTGFPLVDAGMRQLLMEGWMHNRVRMVVASFLSKLCLIDWRMGEAHFMAHLLDGDLASNNGGWQWSSATGCDAAPYFRIFNPTTQSKKFDPDGTYIRKYVPELDPVTGKEIHDPKPEIRKECGYPNPMIDYRSARAQALDWFKQ
jgi:deoxyribodipyrimidine photo-lyase